MGATCTAFGAKHLRELAADPNRIDLVYHGLDLSRFPDAPARRLRAPSDTFEMMSVGRMVEKKGFDNLIDALALLPKTLDWRWTHIGGGALSDAMKTRAQDHGINDRIIWRLAPIHI